MDVTIDKKKGVITITMPLNKKPQPSKSGKSLVLFSTSGNKPTNVTYDDQTVIAGINLYIPNPNR